MKLDKSKEYMPAALTVKSPVTEEKLTAPELVVVVMGLYVVQSVGVLTAMFCVAEFPVNRTIVKSPGSVLMVNCDWPYPAVVDVVVIKAKKKYTFAEPVLNPVRHESGSVPA